MYKRFEHYILKHIHNLGSFIRMYRSKFSNSLNLDRLKNGKKKNIIIHFLYIDGYTQQTRWMLEYTFLSARENPLFFAKTHWIFYANRQLNRQYYQQIEEDVRTHTHALAFNSPFCMPNCVYIRRCSYPCPANIINLWAESMI